MHWLLLKHQYEFSKNENDLDHTHLVWHTIDTFDAKAIKQPPHYLLMAFAEGIVRLWPRSKPRG